MTPGLRAVRWTLGTAGVLVIGLGAFLLLRGAPTAGERISAGFWLLVPAVAVDVLVLPVVALLAAGVRRLAPPPWRTPLIVALVLTAVTLAIGWPFVGGFGRLPDNPSLLDRPYLAGAAVVIALVWAGCAVAGLLAVRRARLPHGKTGTS